jgi:hypothetical protein
MHYRIENVPVVGLVGQRLPSARNSQILHFFSNLVVDFSSWIAELLSSHTKGYRTKLCDSWRVEAGERLVPPSRGVRSPPPFLLCKYTHTPVQSGALRAKKRRPNGTPWEPRGYALQALARAVPTGTARGPPVARRLGQAAKRPAPSPGPKLGEAGGTAPLSSGVLSGSPKVGRLSKGQSGHAGRPVEE